MSFLLHGAALSVLLAAASEAVAQPATPVPPAAPAASTAAGYRSALDGYQRFSDQPLAGWRESNEIVGRIGGWKAYAREAQGATPATADTAAPAARPMPSSPPGQSTPKGGAGHQQGHQSP